jgi:hypothetical protein
MTVDETEIPRSRSMAIQSERVRRRSPRARTAPAMRIAPPERSSFSVSVVLPASGCEMIAKVRRVRQSSAGAAVAAAGPDRSASKVSRVMEQQKLRPAPILPRTDRGLPRLHVVEGKPEGHGAFDVAVERSAVA